MSVKIAVLIPAYNAQDFIIEALDSISNQLRRPEEIIVIDDGSKDNTASLIKQWSLNKKTSVNLIQQENKGLPAARNRGIIAATADWIALLDADDRFLPNHLAKMEQAITSQPDVIAVFGDGAVFGPPDVRPQPFSRHKAIAAADTINSNGIYIIGKKLYSSLIPGNYIMPCCFVFKRSVAINIGMFDESMRFIEDRDFMLRLSRKGNFGFIDHITAEARTHDDNITHPKNATRNTYFALRVLKKALDHAVEIKLDSDELKLTKTQFRQTMSQLIYSSSMNGLKSYLQAQRHLAGMPFTTADQFNPKHLLRAIYYSIRNSH